MGGIPKARFADMRPTKADDNVLVPLKEMEPWLWGGQIYDTSDGRRSRPATRRNELETGGDQAACTLLNSQHSLLIPTS